MEAEEDLLQWAKDRGIVADGIELVKIPGRGIGVVAQRQLKRGETILTIPMEVIRSLHTVPKEISQKLPRDISIHCLLATELVLDESAEPSPWQAALPTLADFEVGTPFMWPPELQKLLPKPAKDLLKKQQARFHKEWNLVSQAFPSISQEEYLHAWFLINTRTFYFETPEMEEYPPDDRLALLPVADLFNHADTGCKVSFSPEVYTIDADRVYNAGQEVYISYGPHSNDFLLAEYGFMLSENQWDKISLDDVILPILNTAQKKQLEERGVLGPFLLDADNSVCSNAQMALSLLCCAQQEAQWWKFLDAENDDWPDRQKKADALLIQLLGDFLGTAKETLEDIRKLRIGQEVQWEVLRQRWEKIQTTVAQTIERLETRTYDRAPLETA